MRFDISKRLEKEVIYGDREKCVHFAQNLFNKEVAKMMIRSKMLLGVLLVGLVMFVGANFNQLQAAEKTPFSGITIHFFAGGSPGGSFAAKVAKGAELAQKLLGVKVVYKWSQWKPGLFVEQFKESVAAHPDAICMMGHAGYNALKDTFLEAQRKGIVVTWLNVDVPKLREPYASAGSGYVGQDLYGAGYYLGTQLLKRHPDIKPGDTALLISAAWEKPGRNQRPIGVEDALKKGGLHCIRIALPEEAHESATKAAPYISGALAKHPETKVLFLDHFEVAAAIKMACEDNGISPKDIYGIGFDLNPTVVDLVKEGYIDLVSDQQPFLQGFLSVINAALAVKYGFSGLYINTGRGLVDASNIDTVAPLVDEGIR